MLDEWFEPRPDGRTHLYCFPHAGGSESLYLGWQQQPSLRVVPVFLPGRGRRADEPALTSAEEIATRLARQIAIHSRQQDIALFGHSMGALLAYATAVALERDHGVVPVRLFAAAAGAPHRPNRLKPVRKLSDDELLAQVLAAGGTPEAVGEDQHALRHALPSLRADAAVVETYHHRGCVLSCPITVLVGRSDPVVTADAARRWSELTTTPAIIRMLPGDHFFVHDPLVVDVVHRELEGSVVA